VTAEEAARYAEEPATILALTASGGAAAAPASPTPGTPVKSGA